MVKKATKAIRKAVRSNRLPVSHPWIAVDLDGTLAYDGYWPEIGPPREGARQFIDALHRRGLKVMIYTARTAMTDLSGNYINTINEIKKIEVWCERHGILIDYIFPLPKPTWIVALVDDRAIHPGTGAAGFEAVLDQIDAKYGKALRWDWRQAVLPYRKEG